jgi:four helix bundle protein
VAEIEEHMSEIRDHRDLEAWQVGMDVVLKTYALSAAFPKSEMYGLSAQMRRAAVSVPSNIAEGQARRTIRACLNHLGIALGSYAELDTQLEVSRRLAYAIPAEAEDLQRCIDSGRRLVHGLYRAKQRRLAVSGATCAFVLLPVARLFA